MCLRVSFFELASGLFNTDGTPSGFGQYPGIWLFALSFPVAGLHANSREGKKASSGLWLSFTTVCLPLREDLG